MKVWVLTRGEYSSRHIVGVFSCLDKAESARSKFSKDECNESYNYPEEFELDSLETAEYGHTFAIRIDMETGDSFSVGSKFDKSLRHPSECEIEIWRDAIYVRSPISREHALKVAAEKRQEWLRTHALSSTPSST